MLLFFIFSLYCPSFLFLGLPRDQGTILVNTGQGVIRGYSNGMSWQFLGIPYALPPVDDLRWADPEPALPWEDIFDASNQPPGCPQNCVLPPGACPSSFSEDCLFLNIYIPLTWYPTSQNTFNVMIFIHGGSFVSGGAGCFLYDGRYLANYTHTIIVTINYRLGALGFLYLDQTSFNGNLGIKDQRLAMEWVARYISEFGGDVSTISLFGQSAGAMSIAAHLVSSQSRGLFKSVVIQSNPWSIPFNTLEGAGTLGSHFLKIIDCNGENIYIVECLKRKSLIQILDAQTKVEETLSSKQLSFLNLLQWGPIIDGIQIKDQPFILIKQGDFNQMPIIVGTTSEEGLFFTDSLIISKLSIMEFEVFLAVSFGLENVQFIKRLYSISDHEQDYRQYIAEIAGDYLFLCPTINLTKSVANIYDMNFFRKIWLYVWEHPASFQAWGPRYPFCEQHACHGVELPFIFSSVDLDEHSFTVDEYSLVRKIQLYWSNMGKYSNPSGFDPGIWPSFNITSQILMIPSSKLYFVHEYRRTFCNFWDSQGYNN